MQIKKINFNLECEYNKHRRNVYSQGGEDGIIEYLLGLAGLTDGYFVEFGAWDGKHLSNSALLADKGWSGCFIEGDETRYQDLIKNYGNNNKVFNLNAYVESSGKNSLDNLLTSVNAPEQISVLSIDIDGNDYHIWESLTNHYALICVIEFNPTIPADVVYIQDNDPNVNSGNSLAALWELAKSKEYELVAATDLNAFFMPRQLCISLGIKTYLPYEVKNTKYETSFFHGYDGEIILGGHKSLLWHGIAFKADNFQIIPKSLRKIPAGQSQKYYEEFDIFKATLK